MFRFGFSFFSETFFSPLLQEGVTPFPPLFVLSPLSFPLILAEIEGKRLPFPPF